ncbi:hypothetical protein FQN54_004781 [Arachnomyces sp. PD_36]|nr:hypothetical protein FQN54_004781 [Arachnomyces sp. PD_36]
MKFSILSLATLLIASASALPADGNYESLVKRECDDSCYTDCNGNCPTSPPGAGIGCSIACLDICGCT